jgi:hypothetical protein
MNSWINGWRTSKERGQTVDFEYFKVEESEQFSFFRIPKALFTEDEFAGLSTDAKLLYGILLDRISLSKKNGWIDKDGFVYIIYTVEELRGILHVSATTITKLLYELDDIHGIGLIERYRQGCNRPSIIYVKNFVKRIRGRPSGSLNSVSPDNQKMEIRSARICKSGQPKSRSPDQQNLVGSNTNKNKTDKNDTDMSERRSPALEESFLLYGRFQNVRLTRKEHQELCAMYPHHYGKLVDHLSSYMKSTGKTYQDHFATLVLWADREGITAGTGKYDYEEGECL